MGANIPVPFVLGHHHERNQLRERRQPWNWNLRHKCDRNGHFQLKHYCINDLYARSQIMWANLRRISGQLGNVRRARVRALCKALPTEPCGRECHW